MDCGSRLSEGGWGWEKADSNELTGDWEMRRHSADRLRRDKLKEPDTQHAVRNVGLEGRRIEKS